MNGTQPKQNMATLKKGKLDAVVSRIEEGGDHDIETIADFIDVDPQEAAIYIRAAKKKLAEQAAPVEEPQYQLKDEAGLLRELEIVKVKGNRTILQIKYVADTVPVLIRGEEVVVDLNELRKLPADSLKDGIKVSVLLAAAELARI